MEKTKEGYSILHPDGDSDDEDDILDPRIKVELDKLNQASAEINKLENELDEARTKYRCTLTETSQKMTATAKGRRKRIEKAREYYKLKEELKKAQGEALKAARQYQTATGIYNAAKETVMLAEERLIEKAENCSGTTAHLSSAWQEMLNHTIQRVMEAEKDKSRSELDHKRTSAKCQELTEKVQGLKKKFKKSIAEAKPYFELTSELEIKLQQQKQNINDLQAAIKANKERYKETLRRLEDISEEIHLSRKNKLWKYMQRTPGVGAEIDIVSSSLSDLDLDLPCTLTSSLSQDFSDPDDELGDKMDDVFREEETDGRYENAEIQSDSELECDTGSNSGDLESFHNEEHFSTHVCSQGSDTSCAERSDRDSLGHDKITSENGGNTLQNGNEDRTVTHTDRGCSMESANSNSQRTSELVCTNKSQSEESSSMKKTNQTSSKGSKWSCTNMSNRTFLELSDDSISNETTINQNGWTST